MDLNDILARIYEWQRILMSREGIPREGEQAILDCANSKPIKIITGFRRSGKSFLLQRIAKTLVQQKIYALEDIFYINFEDYQFSELIKAADLDRVYQYFLEKADKTTKKLLVLDEIQNIQDWDKFVRTIYEMSQHIEIFLTGSNSELLSSELGSNLAGRFIEFTVYPFSFREFLLYHNIHIQSETELLQNKKEILLLFSEYLEFGGLPETFDIANKEAKISYLKGIMNKVILDDIVKRYNISNVDILERIFVFLMKNVGRVISYSRIRNHCLGMDIPIKSETIIKYVDYFKKTFAIKELSKFNWKQNSVFSTSQKYFSIDTGLLSIFRTLKENYAFRLENLIYLELLRQDLTAVYYGVNDSGKEIDFIVHKTDAEWEKYQVTYELTEENKHRELGNFSLAGKYLSPSHNYLLSLQNNSDYYEYQKAEIHQINIMNWLLTDGNMAVMPAKKPAYGITPRFR